MPMDDAERMPPLGVVKPQQKSFDVIHRAQRVAPWNSGTSAARLVTGIRGGLHRTRTGRTGMAPDRLLRCCVMKHMKGWSFRDLERELRSNLVYRRFTHFDAEATPDFSTFSRSFTLLSPAVTQEIHQRVVGLAREQGVAPGRKLRTDTTVDMATLCYTSLSR